MLTEQEHNRGSGKDFCLKHEITGKLIVEFKSLVEAETKDEAADLVDNFLSVDLHCITDGPMYGLPHHFNAGGIEATCATDDCYIEVDGINYMEWPNFNRRKL